jgi:hypothetical protein
VTGELLQEHLRVAAAELGITPTPADLEGVAGFLAALLPALVEIERLLTPETAPDTLR